MLEEDAFGWNKRGIHAVCHFVAGKLTVWLTGSGIDSLFM